MCNILNKAVKIVDVDLFSNATIAALPDISTLVWVKQNRLSVFEGEIGIMETVFPHCQQTFQHKCSAINEVMLTTRRFLTHVPVTATACFLPVRMRIAACPGSAPACRASTRRRAKTPGARGSRGGWLCCGAAAHWPMSWQ